MNNNLKVALGTVAGIMIGGLTVVGANQAIQAIQNTEIKVSLNGKIQEFKDETTGEKQYPITYNNRTYLPLRNVAQLAGLNVDYDSKSNTAVLNKTNTPKIEDLETLLYLHKNLNTIVDREDVYDSNGNLIYYLKNKYFESVIPRDMLENDAKEDSKKMTLLKILNDCGKEQKLKSPYSYEFNKEAQKFISNDIPRIEPDDLYYDENEYEIVGVHNGIITISKYFSSWQGQPHPMWYKLYSVYDSNTGDYYQFPKEYHDEIIDKATKKLIEIAKENDYEGLLGDHYIDNEKHIYLNKDTKEFNEEEFELLAKEMLNAAGFEIDDDKITFYIIAQYNLSTWADKATYSSIVIPNEWNL